ncbi:hypothetical protein BDN70DRAFT_344610 [Pholiota conissans]|uniref:Heterokaryon incompatibility domain-containing protein n=1 Tax=Pholiota conissans TaxID=109636 RepID=A0A9P5YS20_9AGAR|nr:hypothetical protein BDN70DRAFT_344610 [Pholiota conissans]
MFSSDKPPVSMLLDALQRVIVPIIHAHSLGIAVKSDDGNKTYESRMESAAQQLVIALDSFVKSLICSQLVEEDRKEFPDRIPELRPPDAATSLTEAYDSTPAILSIIPAPPWKPRLLRLAIDEARHRIFNKIPIRLLAFSSNRSDIKLLERNQIWDLVLSLLEVNFNEEVMDRLVTDGNEDSVVDQFISRYVRYATLSHTWIPGTRGEVTYIDWKNGTFDTSSPGYQKLAHFCRVSAVDHRITLGWMDTICINKESSTELDESIRSMYKWYHDADICITYLSQTQELDQMHSDVWFTRGWTLQELLAPRCTKFYRSNWSMISPKCIDDRNELSIAQEIEGGSTITPSELDKFRKSSDRIPISRRMQWAANRQVTREEDTAYSLMGIFDISLSIAYGEGAERAFFRLVKKILRSTKRNSLDVVNWGSGFNDEAEGRYTSDHPSALIPSSPRNYVWRTTENLIWFPPAVPITLTHLGLHLSVLLMPAVLTEYSPAQIHQYNPIGEYFAVTSVIDMIDHRDSENGRKTFKLLDKALKSRNNNANARESEYPTATYQRTFGVLNFSEQEKTLFLPDGCTCFAVCLYPRFHSGNFERMPTSKAVSFPLRRLQGRGDSGYVPKSELAKHGMELVTMYL